MLVSIKEIVLRILNRIRRRPVVTTEPVDNVVAFKTPLPRLSQADAERGLIWVHSTTGEPMIVCSFCGGNCGQCGVTGRVGNVPASMQTMADNLNRDLHRERELQKKRDKR